MLTTETVAQELSLSESDVIQEGLRALLLREIARAEAASAQIRERYGMLAPAELVQAIADNKVPGHPAWEDYIDWQNCLEAIKSMETLLTEADDGRQRAVSEVA